MEFSFKFSMHLQQISESTIFQCNYKLLALQTPFPVNEWGKYLQL
jgi:hypothetical protein